MYFFSYPESGENFLLYLLAYYLKFSKTNYSKIFVEEKTFHTIKSRLNSFISADDNQAMIMSIKNQDSSKVKQEPSIYLVRDIRDLIFVKYHQLQKSSQEKQSSKKSSFPIKFYQKVSSGLGRNNFSKLIRRNTLSWASHVEAGLEKEPTVIVRYEDLQTLPKYTLISVLMKLDIEVCDNIVQDSVSALTAEQTSDNTLIANSAIKRSQNWEKYFSDSNYNFIKKKAGTLLEKLGYDNFD